MTTTTLLNAIIVDDEPNAVNNLRKLIATYCPSINVTDTAPSAAAAAMLINETKPDVVFLDVSMPGKNGFDLINLLTHIPYMVFVTAYEKYAIKAIKASAVDFLLKPVDVSELKYVEEKLQKIHMFRSLHGKESYISVLGNLVNIMQDPGVVRTITVPDLEGYTILDTKDIIYLEGINNYTSFHLIGQPKIMVSKTLKEYEEMLSGSGFMRIHKSSIINMVHLKKLIMVDGLHALMTDGSALAVSRRKAGELVEKAKQYNF